MIICKFNKKDLIFGRSFLVHIKFIQQPQQIILRTVFIVKDTRTYLGLFRHVIAELRTKDQTILGKLGIHRLGIAFNLLIIPIVLTLKTNCCGITVFFQYIDNISLFHIISRNGCYLIFSLLHTYLATYPRCGLLSCYPHPLPTFLGGPPQVHRRCLRTAFSLLPSVLAKIQTLE